MHGSVASTTDVFAPPTNQILPLPLPFDLACAMLGGTEAKHDRQIASKNTHAYNLLPDVGLNTP